MKRHQPQASEWIASGATLQGGTDRRNVEPRYVHLGVALAATVAWPEWIEELSGLSPDGGSGAAEWLVPAVLAMGAVASSLVALREWLRPPAVA